jgi:predicted anti-sigma-YlaC factor YlaD
MTTMTTCTQAAAPLFLCALVVINVSCSLRTYAVNTVGDALASGNSVYESDSDIELVGAALPFGLKLTESLLAESPHHEGLLLTACRGFTMYSYAYVASDAERLADEDLDRARVSSMRARRLYLRGAQYGFRALERRYPGFEQALTADPQAAVTRIPVKSRSRDVPFLYWTAAALGLAASVSSDDAALLARLPEVEAMVDRALQLDESWSAGALHEFKLVIAAGRSGRAERAVLDAHYARALALSHGASAGLFVAYAEAVSLPAQNETEFRAMLERALAIDPDRQPRDRLATLISQRKARWLLDRVDDLILTAGSETSGGSR